LTVTQGGSRRIKGRPNLITIAGLFLCALTLIAFGVLMLSLGQSGTPARIRVVECQLIGKSTSCKALWPPPDLAPQGIVPIANADWRYNGQTVDVVRDGRTVRVTVVECHVHYSAIDCTGVSPPSITPLQTIDVQGADGGDVGHDIDAHLHQNPYLRATADDNPTPYLMLTFGGGAAVAAVVLSVLRMVRPSWQSQWAQYQQMSGQVPWGGPGQPGPWGGTMAAPGTFVATAASGPSGARRNMVAVGSVVVAGLVLFGASRLSPLLRAPWLHAASYALLLALTCLIFWVGFSPRSRLVSGRATQIWISSTGYGVEVNRGTGEREIFPQAGTTLGPWANGSRVYGTTLNLQNAQHRFVLGGRQRAPSGLRLDAPPVRTVDAWMPAADFDALIASIYQERRG
jgi:hypothetical protein